MPDVAIQPATLVMIAGTGRPVMEVSVAPQNMAAERCLLWLGVRDNSVLDVNIPPAAFYDRRHRDVYSEMVRQQAVGQEFDLLTLTDALRTAGKLNGDGTLEYISDFLLTEEPPATHSAENAARIIREHHRRREEIASTRSRLEGLKDGSIPAPSEDEDGPQFNLSDSGNANLFEHLNRDDALHCNQDTRWYIFNGKFYERDDNRHIMDLADSTVQKLYDIAGKIPDKTTREKVAAHALSSESKVRLEAMIGLARHRCGIRIDEFDQNPMLFNAQNGTVDLTTADLRPHSPEDLITKIAAAPYIEGAPCPTWKEHLRLVFDGDQILIKWFQLVVGYILTGDTSEQIILFLWGNGNNGKSVTVNTLARILGSYATATRAETLLRKRHSGGANNDVAALVGSRCVAIGEGLRNRSLDEDLVKSLTGGDTITARFLHHEFFNFTPTFKILWSTNHLPKIGDTTESIWRRIRLIPFNVQIPPEVRDPHIEDKLKEEWPGILAWAVEGCLRWQEKGLDPPDVVTSAVSGYRAEEDPINDFLQECTVTGPDMKSGATALYNAYRDYCEQVGEHHMKQKGFGQLLNERGYEKTKQKSGVVYLKIGLLETQKGEG